MVANKDASVNNQEKAVNKVMIRRTSVPTAVTAWFARQTHIEISQQSAVPN